MTRPDPSGAALAAVAAATEKGTASATVNVLATTLRRRRCWWSVTLTPSSRADGRAAAALVHAPDGAPPCLRGSSHRTSVNGRLLPCHRHENVAARRRAAG